MERWLDIPIYSFRCEKFPKTVWKREPKTFKGGKLIRVVLQNHTIVYVQRNKLRGVSGKGEVPFVFEYQIDYEQEYKMSFLKSVLQKAIRRQDLYYAITSAKQIYLQDPIQLIRRLLIIMVEDTILVENWFQTLCWLTCQKEFSKRQVEWLMGVVYRICLEYRKAEFVGCLSREMGLSIRLRKKYGGMKWDMNMLGELRTGIYSREHTYISWDSIPKFEIDPRDRTLKSAIDFHISKVDRYIEDKCEIKIDRELIRKLIWNYRSSYNKRESSRRCYCREDDCERCDEYELYREIERDLDKYSYFKLKNMIED